MPATPQPRTTITIDDLAAIATRIQPLTRSTKPDAQTTHHIETIFHGYGIAFNDAPTTDEETSCR